MTSPLLPVEFLGPLPAGVSVLRTEPQIFCYSTFRNLTIAVWVGQATVSAVRSMGEISQRMVREHPEGHSSVVFILDKLPPPQPEARELLNRAFHARNDLACVAVVIEGTGFWASGMRSMIGNAHRAVATATAMHLNTTCEEVAEWLPPQHERRTGVALDPKELVQVLRSVRAHGAELALKG